MKVLVACEFSGRVRDAFIAKGHDAVSCDLLPTEQPGPHIQGDVRDVLGIPKTDYPVDIPEKSYKPHRKFDLLIAHPPCTYLTNSGIRWLFDYKGKSLESWEIFALTGYTGKEYRKVNIKRFIKMHKAAWFFAQLLLVDIPMIAIENPIQHQYAYESILSRMPFDKIRCAQYNQIIHPWQFGHSEKKSTCLWLKNLPPLTPIKFIDNRINPNRGESVWKEPPGPDRWKNRSRTFPGIAEAMADQWGVLA